MDYFYQVIRSDNSFTIHEYLYDVRSNNSAVQPIGELSFTISKFPNHAKAIATIYGTCKTVRDASDYKNKV